MSGKIIGGFRHAVLREIIRCRHNHARNGGDQPRGCRGVGELAQPDGHIDRIAHQVLLLILEHQVDAQPRMTRCEPRQTWNHITDTETGRHTHAQQPTKLTARVVRDSSRTPRSCSNSATVRET